MLIGAKKRSTRILRQVLCSFERAAEQQGLSRPFKLCMTKETWHTFIDEEAKEYITQQMDAGELIVEITNDAPHKTIFLMENRE